MKSNFFILVLSASTLFSAFGQSELVNSQVYKWSEAKEQKTKYGSQREFFNGPTTDLKKVDFKALNVNKDQSYDGIKTNDTENLIIVKDGTLNIIVNQKPYDLTPGSIALIMPGDELSVQNKTKSSVTFFLMTYVGMNQDETRLEDGQGSIVKIWEDIAFKTHDRGGIRNYYNQPTVMTEYFEMHVTNLNGLIKSHEPHTHRAAEIVLMIKGNTEMQIAEKFYQGNEGDIYFLGSEVSHAIENKGSEQCMYFAFQWN